MTWQGKRILSLLWAQVRCFFYLLFVGMWRGECEFKGWDKNKRLIVIAACRMPRPPLKNRPSLEWVRALDYTRIFYCDEQFAREVAQAEKR